MSWPTGRPVEQFGPVSIPCAWSQEARARALREAVSHHLPREWSGKVRLLARAAMGCAERSGAFASIVPHAARAREIDLLAHWLRDYAGAHRAADLDEQGIRDRAQWIATQAEAQRLSDHAPTVELVDWWQRLDVFARNHGAVLACPQPLNADDLSGIAKRLCCARWWRRAVRRWVVQLHERGAIELGLIGAGARQFYCSDRAVKRRLLQQAAAEEAMRAQTIESDTGQRMTLWDCAQKTVSNKSIRRGELMTRIKGCEEWADAHGLRGLFITCTAPSRFHSQRKGGGRNPSHDGSTPAQAQAWLCATWAKLRAKWSRDKIGVFGFRIAEPHHDGCPHWHMLIWCDPGQLEAVQKTLREWWLKDCGDEPGAALYRTNIKAMQPGGAAGYVAKYVSKNIDDSHVTEHLHGAEKVGPDLWDGQTVTPAMRVEAWAAAWRIRQFQAIGQPPVTVWRELRRVDRECAEGGSAVIRQAWHAVHRHGATLADWSAYIGAQGGTMRRRTDYRLCVHAVERERLGRYGRMRIKWASGVQDRQAGPLGVVPTRRRAWGAVGFAAAKPAAPWTRLNNCTRPAAINRPVIDPFLTELRPLIENGLLDCDKTNIERRALAIFRDRLRN